MKRYIDTLKFARRFEETGFTSSQADALALAMAETATAIRASASKAPLLLDDSVSDAFADLRSTLSRSVHSMRDDVIRGIVVSQTLLIVVLIMIASVAQRDEPVGQTSAHAPSAQGTAR